MGETRREALAERRLKKFVAELKRKKRSRRKIQIALILVISIAIFTTVNSGSFGATEKQYESVIVQSGDTLWGIAKDHSGGKDISERVYELKEINNLQSGSDLKPGMEIKIPM